MTREISLEDRYLRHLSQFVGFGGKEDLLGQLYNTPFVWVVPNDANRCEDGRDLRHELFNEMAYPELWEKLDEDDVSVLEVLAALAERMSFQWDKFSIHECFVLYLDNLTLTDFLYKWTGTASFVVDDILTDWMSRNIEPNGERGLFPLERPRSDQRKIEIWYQMAAYLIEAMEADGFLD